jgi:hypothetical protein
MWISSVSFEWTEKLFTMRASESSNSEHHWIKRIRVTDLDWDVRCNHFTSSCVKEVDFGEVKELQNSENPQLRNWLRRRFPATTVALTPSTLSNLTPKLWIEMGSALRNPSGQLMSAWLQQDTSLQAPFRELQEHLKGAFSHTNFISWTQFRKINKDDVGMNDPMYWDIPLVPGTVVEVSLNQYAGFVEGDEISAAELYSIPAKTPHWQKQFPGNAESYYGTFEFFSEGTWEIDSMPSECDSEENWQTLESARSGIGGPRVRALKAPPCLVVVSTPLHPIQPRQKNKKETPCRQCFCA